MTTTEPYLLAAEPSYSDGVLTVDYSWDGALPTQGPVSLIISLHPRDNPGKVIRYGIKWVDEAMSSLYVFDQSERPMNDNEAGSYTLGVGHLRVQFGSLLEDLGTDLVWTAVICTDYDLEPTVSGVLIIGTRQSNA